MEKQRKKEVYFSGLEEHLTIPSQVKICPHPSPPEVDRIWLWVPMYPIFYLLKGDY